jgi:TetR/AcrR family transcriptional regulator, regulator of mycofactocin system
MPLACKRGTMAPSTEQNQGDQPLSLQLRAKRTEMMVSELEEVALRLFDQCGFVNVTVEEIAVKAGISVRTFYRYFASKEDILQLRIFRRSEALRQALAVRPVEEPPLHSIRVALVEEFSAADPIVQRRWIAVVADNPNVLRGVVGAIQLKVQPVIAEFFCSRLEMPADALVPTMLAAATLGVIQAAHTQWFIHNGDFAATMSESLAVLERTIRTDSTTLGVEVDRSTGSSKRRKPKAS